MSNSCKVWSQGNTLCQQFNKFCTLSFSFEETKECLLTSSTIEGPFYLPNSIVRKDIRENQPGLPLHLMLKIVDVGGCRPIANAAVDIWHANAFGVYSGYEGVDLPPIDLLYLEEVPHIEPINNLTFLRGRQYTDQDGLVEFFTIFPSWYEFRTVHIHIKVFVEGRNLLTTQLFFPQDLNCRIQSTQPYNVRSLSPFTNANDTVLRDSHGVQGGWPRTIQRGTSFTSTLTIGVYP